MSAPQFTPGPWSVEENIDGWEINDNLDGGVAVTVFNDSETEQANAHLIAAAPELYEAITTWLADFNDDRRDLQLEQDHAARFRLAIAKADGDSRGVS